MASILTNKVTRDKLAAVFKNQELIKLIENLTIDVSTALPTGLDEIDRITRLALALAGQAMILVGEASEDQAMSIPGPVGQKGDTGAAAALFMLNEDPPEPEMQFMLTAQGVVPGGAVALTAITALTNGAGAAAGTLLNAPAAGDPTKWISIDDGGTIRKIPTW